VSAALSTAFSDLCCVVKASERAIEVRKSPVNTILTSRLAEFVNPWKRLGIRRTRQLTGRLQQYLSDDRYDERGYSYHHARIRFFLAQLRDGKPLDPIELDNQCHYNCVDPFPVLLDGHHRFAALILAGVPKLAAHYGGRMDLLRYLQGRRKSPPQE